MKYYAIQDRDTGLFISSTNFARIKPRQILSSPLRPPILFTGGEITRELKRRHIKLKYYKVVVVEVKEAEL